MEENVVLCGSSAYEKKYYLNPDFESLPDSIKDELKIMCVLFTEDIGGVLTLEYTEDGTLEFKVMCDDYDALIELMTHDKKNVAGKINFTLLGGIGDIRIDQVVKKELIKESLDFFREG